MSDLCTYVFTGKNSSVESLTLLPSIRIVFRATKDILKANCLMAIIIWVGTLVWSFILEQNNPNYRECDVSGPLLLERLGSTNMLQLGCLAYIV